MSKTYHDTILNEKLKWTLEFHYPNGDVAFRRCNARAHLAMLLEAWLRNVPGSTGNVSETHILRFEDVYDERHKATIDAWMKTED